MYWPTQGALSIAWLIYRLAWTQSQSTGARASFVLELPAGHAMISVDRAVGGQRGQKPARGQLSRAPACGTTRRDLAGQSGLNTRPQDARRDVARASARTDSAVVPCSDLGPLVFESSSGLSFGGPLLNGPAHSNAKPAFSDSKRRYSAATLANDVATSGRAIMPPCMRGEVGADESQHGRPRQDG